MSEIWIYNWDSKAEHWSEGASDLGCTLRPIPKPVELMPLRLLLAILRRGKRPRAVVFRYLNDYTSLWKSVVRAISDIFVVLMCRTARIPIRWICHNVDRETVVVSERLTRWRREVVAYNSERIFVTDPALLPHARIHITNSNASFGVTTFGTPSPVCLTKDERSVLSAISRFRCEAVKESNSLSQPLIGFCAGDSMDKVYHYKYLPDLIKSAESCGWSIYMVVIGAGAAHAVDEAFHGSGDRLRHRVMVYPRRVTFDNRRVGDLVDFWWRAYDDLSVPFSLYGAMAGRRPILALRSGFLAEAVERYNLGATVELGFNDLDQAMKKICAWDPAAADQFLQSRDWRSAGRALVAGLQ